MIKTKLKTDSNILYSFRRCPYAIRARWALLMTENIVVLREVLLSKKPKELFVASSKGTVPVLVTNDGKVIDQSIDIMRWALDKNNKLNRVSTGNSSEQKIIRDVNQVYLII